LVISVSRDPAEKTSTSPLGLAVAELEGLEEVEALLEELLLDELLQAVAATVRQVMHANAAICAPRR
jgi:hypothetical protein